MCLPQTHGHGNSSSPCSQFLKNHNLVVPSCQSYSNNWSQDQDNLDLQSSDYLESLMKFPIQNNQSLKSDLFELLWKSAKQDNSLKWRPNYISFWGKPVQQSEFIHLLHTFVFCIQLRITVCFMQGLNLIGDIFSGNRLVVILAILNYQNQSPWKIVVLYYQGLQTQVKLALDGLTIFTINLLNV